MTPPEPAATPARRSKVTWVLEKLYLLGLAALFFGPLAAINGSPPGTTFMQQARMVGLVVAGVFGYLAVLILIGWAYHRNKP